MKVYKREYYGEVGTAMKIGTIILAIGGLLLLLSRRARASTPAGRLPPCGDSGDVDGDGYVTEEDAELVSQYVVGDITLSQAQLLRADVNGDGQVGIIDALTIRQYTSGEIDTFPVCDVIIPPPPPPVGTPTIHGRVSDAATGQPLAGVRLFIQNPFLPSQTWETFTDTGGNYFYRLFRTGQFFFTFTKDGYAFYPLTLAKQLQEGDNELNVQGTALPPRAGNVVIESLAARITSPTEINVRLIITNNTGGEGTDRNYLAMDLYFSHDDSLSISSGYVGLIPQGRQEINTGADISNTGYRFSEGRGASIVVNVSIIPHSSGDVAFRGVLSSEWRNWEREGL